MTPNELPRPPGEFETLEQAWRRPRGLLVLTAVNNTMIGRLYIATSLIFFILAGLLGLLVRAQLALPGNSLLSAGAYNQVFTMHGTVMMFLFAIPVVEAFAVFLLPGMLGARDLPFPRLSAYAFWAYAIGGLAFFCTLFVGLAPDGGWFMYPPLTNKVWSPGLGADFWLLGIGFIEISAIAGAVELIIGILFTRAPGMSLRSMPIFAWAMLVVGVMIVFAFPAVIAGTALLELERAYDWPFFGPDRGGDPVLWQHLFWFFGHPEVYIIFLPAAGMVSMMLAALCGVQLVGRREVIWSLALVGMLSFALWAHHMFTAGLGILETTLVSAASMAIAIPTAVQVFAWIGTLWRGKVEFNTPTLFIFGFLFIFVLGGLTGVMVAVLPFDWQAHDTYFIVAHFHYVLVGGLVFPMFAAMYYWMPLMGGHRMSERIGRWAFGVMFTGFNVAFFPMHIAGLLGMPRRVYTWQSGLGWDVPNMLSSAGAALLACGIALTMLDLLRTLHKPERAHGNPWNAGTLEWLPQDEYATRSIPQVFSEEPLWEQPGLGDEVEAGAHWLPGAVTGGRETLVTSWIHAVPQYLLVLPGDSWLPFLGALGTAGFFLLLTVHMAAAAWICGVGAIAAILAWLWQRHPGADMPVMARVGARLALPVGAPGRGSHSWWATVIVMVVDVSIFLSFAFAFVHAAMRLAVCPPPGAGLPGGAFVGAGCALLAASSALLAWPRRPARQLARLASASTCLLAGAAVMVAAYWTTGLNPRVDAWSAGIGAMLAYHGLHVAALIVAAGYLAARIAANKPWRAEWDNTALFWHGAVLQGIAGALLPAAA
jgi:cytochrome c oxidase subunit I+III